MKDLSYLTCEYIDEILAEEINLPIEKNNSHYESIGALAEALENIDFTSKQITKGVNLFFASVVNNDSESIPPILTALKGNCIANIAEAIALKIRVDEAIATAKSGCDNE